MATTSTITALKAALLDEIQALTIASATAAAPPEVQVSYGRPPADQQRSESGYFADDMHTTGYEYRLTDSRRRRYVTW